MKKAIASALLCCFFNFGFGQRAEFLIGAKGGVNGCFYVFNTNQIPVYSTNIGTYTKIVSSGPAIPALFELIFGTKKFRVGYQFEYERILTTSYRYKTFNASQAYVDTTVGDNSITQHYFCHNLLMEIIAYNNKRIKIVPDITFGYFHGLAGPTLAPYDISQLNQNRFKIGVALNFEYWLGPVGIVATPDFSVEPIKAAIDPNAKGNMFLVGLNIGLRFSVTKAKQDKDGNPKKKKKEYVNPEEEN